MTTKLRNILIGAGVVFLAIVIALISYGGAQARKYQQAVGALEVLTAEYESYKESADGLMAGLNASIADLVKQREAAIAKANAAANQQAATQAALDKLKTETASLPPDALSERINTFIGQGAIVPTGGSRFSLSRPGADNTLNLFYERDAYRTQYASEQSVTSNLRVALNYSVDETSAWKQKFALKSGELEKAVDAWSAEHDALTALKRSIFGRKVKTFVIGAGVGAAAVVVYNLIKEP